MRHLWMQMSDNGLTNRRKIRYFWVTSVLKCNTRRTDVCARENRLLSSAAYFFWYTVSWLSIACNWRCTGTEPIRWPIRCYMRCHKSVFVSVILVRATDSESFPDQTLNISYTTWVIDIPPISIYLILCIQLWTYSLLARNVYWAVTGIFSRWTEALSGT